LVVAVFVLASGWPGQAGEQSEGGIVALDLALEPEDARSETSRRGRAAWFDCLKNEPDVHRLVRVAWEEAGLTRDEDRSRKTRVRVSGWLPKISAGFTTDMGDRWDYRYEPGTPRVDQIHQDEGVRWDAGVSWDLSRTVFRSEELQVAREASRRVRERMDLAAEVIRLYFARRRLVLQGPPSPGSPVVLQITELTVMLNALTGARFRQSWCRVADREAPQP
jgi:hypothetical protein